MFEYFTHQPMLAAVIARSTGPILELGCGWGSTVWLHGLCAAQGRLLVSLEGNNDWLQQFAFLQSEKHQLRLVNGWEELEEYQKQWSVVLVDHGDASRRATSIEKLRGNADYLVCHDSDFAAMYGYDKIFPTFKNIFTYTKLRPHTAVVSDLQDLRFLSCV
jgi:hypothetical protein